MGKRASNGNASGRAPKKIKGDESGVLSDQVENEKGAIASLSWWDPVMESLDTIFETHTSLSNWLSKEFPTPEARLEMAKELKDAFPLPEGEVLSNDFGPGIKTWALWQACFHPQAGNKGLVVRDFMKNLIQLVLLGGPKTDASKLPGVEFPVVQELVPAYFESEWKTSTVIDGAYECQSLGFIKGWTRALAFLTAGWLIITHELVDYYKDKMPTQFQNFCVLKALVPENAGSEIDRIAANRGCLVLLWYKRVYFDHKKNCELN